MNQHPRSDFTGEVMELPFVEADLPDLRLIKRGATKDLFTLDDERLLLICTDRVRGQATVAGRGRVLHALSTYWFDKLGQVFPNHLISPCLNDVPSVRREDAKLLDGRAMVVRKAQPLPFTCIVCGYLVEGVWEEYRHCGTALGFEMPEGMTESQRLPAPLFGAAVTPSLGWYGNLLGFSDLVDVLGGKQAMELREASLRLYMKAWRQAREKGILIAETLFSFGTHRGELILIDECLTTDSSRFWPLEDYRFGRFQPPPGQSIVDLPQSEILLRLQK